MRSDRGRKNEEKKGRYSSTEKKIRSVAQKRKKGRK